MPDENSKDWWDITDIFLKPVGGLLTALAVGFVGYFGTQSLNRTQAFDTNARLYAQLMSQREDAETSLRKDMFNSIIGTFLKPQKVQPKDKVLNLELLSYNFHEALDLSPLFKDVYREIDQSAPSAANDSLKRRLELAAEEVKGKQINALEEAGRKKDITINLDDIEKSAGGMKLIDGELSSRLADPNDETPLQSSRPADPSDETSLPNPHFTVEALLVDKKKKQIRVKLEVKTPVKGGASNKDQTNISYSVFWISPFDFPMIDNTRLPYGQRCAIVLRKFGDPMAQLTVIYFPGSRASLKEKPYYEEAMRELLSTGRQLVSEEKGK